MALAQERLGAGGAANVEWLELGLRNAFSKDAVKILESLFADPGLKIPRDEKAGGEKRMRGQKKTVQFIFGEVTLTRNYYYNPVDKTGRYPLDEALGVSGGYSPGMQRLICRAAARDSYEVGSADLKAYANIEIDGRQINRVVDSIAPLMREELEKERLPQETKAVPRFYISADGSGVPMRKEELEETAGKGPDGRAKTKEVKLGCVFTQHPDEKEEAPFRDCDSTSYVATMRAAGEFGALLRQEAFRRGMGLAGEIIFLGDGAAWIWEMVRVNFNGAVEILDYFHACEYLTAITLLLFGKDSIPGNEQLRLWKEAFFEDKIEEVISQARKLATETDCDQEAVTKKINYFENNKDRMKYGTYKRKGYFYGSGVIEAGCKNVVGKRAKQSGMFWSKQGAENVLAIRAALYSDRFDQYWDLKNAA